MPSKAARRTVWLIAGAAILALAFVALLPLLASTQIVRNRIATELSEWSGYRVVLRDAPRVQVWPSFQAELSGVSFQQWGGDSSQPVLESERIEMDLSAIAALRGDVSFTKVSILRPVIRVSASDGAFPLPLPPGGGRMVRAIDRARTVVDANPAQPDASLMPSDPLGAVEFIDGRVLRAGVDGDEEILSSLSGRASWPTLDRPANLSFRGIWRGESLSVEAGIQQPLALLAGGNSRVSLAFGANPLSGSFDGLLTLSRSGFIDGIGKLSSPSLRRALEWSQVGISPGAAVGNATIAGRLVGDRQRLKIEKAEINLGGHSGEGLLEVSLGGAVPGLSGTLAFQSIDVRSFLQAFVRLPGGEATWTDPIDMDFTRQLDLDLRLSSARASAGPVQFTEVAATAQIKDGLAVFDISDSTAFGGTVQTGLRIDRRSDKDQAEVRFLATDVDVQGFGEAAGFGKALPQARGTASAILTGPARQWDAMLARAEGSISLKLGPGTVTGPDLDAFLQRTAEGGFFPLGEIRSGTIAFEAAEFRSTVMNGVARLDTATVTQAQKTIAFTGILPLVGQGIALSGSVAPRPADAAAPAAAPLAAFFVGGSWQAPFVSPILTSFPPD